MIYVKYDTYKMEKNEPLMRSCPECNSAHDHLMKTDYLHVCMWCGRYWIFGRYLNSFKTDKARDSFLKRNCGKAHKAYAKVLSIKLVEKK